MEKFAIKDLDVCSVQRPRFDGFRLLNKMNRISVSEEKRLELDRILLMNLNYRAHVCIIFCRLARRLGWAVLAQELIVTISIDQ